MSTKTYNYYMKNNGNTACESCMNINNLEIGLTPDTYTFMTETLLAELAPICDICNCIIQEE